MNRIETLLNYLKTAQADSFLQHALALEYIKVGNDGAAEKLFKEILHREPTYVGSYYHLAKLLERQNQYDAAIEIYTLGMKYAKELKDNHSYNELQAALEEIEE